MVFYLDYLLRKKDWKDLPNDRAWERMTSGGVSIAFSAPIDALYAASAIGEWVWSSCEAEFENGDAPDFQAAVSEIQAAIDEEVNPALLDLQRAAAERDISFLWDDDEVSVGHGSHSKTWPFRELPDPGSLDWSQYRNAPAFT